MIVCLNFRITSYYVFNAPERAFNANISVFFRVPLGDKLYERDLEAALTLSLLQKGEIEEQCSENKGLHWFVVSLQLVLKDVIQTPQMDVLLAIDHRSKHRNMSYTQHTIDHVRLTVNMFEIAFLCMYISYLCFILLSNRSTTKRCRSIEIFELQCGHQPFG